MIANADNGKPKRKRGPRRQSGSFARFRRGLLAPCLAVLAWLACVAPASSQTAPESLASPVEHEVFAALDDPPRLTPGRKTLEGLAKEVAREYGINVVLDRRALDNAGVDDADTTVRILPRATTLAASLRIALEPADLDLVVRNEAVVITASEDAENETAVRVHNVGDLVNDAAALAGAAGDGRGRRYSDFDSLIELITSIVSPESWDEGGGPGSIQEWLGDSPASDALVFGQTLAVHRQVESLLVQLRQARRARPDRNGDPTPSCVRDKSNEVADVLLAERADWRWQDISLADLASQLSSQLGAPAVIDVKGLADAGLNADGMIVAFECRDCPLETALRLALAPLKLDVAVQNGAIYISTEDTIEGTSEIRVYPVGDIVQSGPAAFGPNSGWTDFDGLMDLVSSIVEPASWDESGGPGAMCEFAGDSAGQHVLALAARRRVHRQVELLLAALRQARRAFAASRTAGPWSLFDPSDVREADRLRSKLAMPVSWDLTGDLAEIAAEISRRHGVPILVVDMFSKKRQHRLEGRALWEALVDLAATFECAIEAMSDGTVIVDDADGLIGPVSTLAWDLSGLARSKKFWVDTRSVRRPLDHALEQAFAKRGVSPVFSVLVDLKGRPSLLVARLPTAQAPTVQRVLDELRGKASAPAQPAAQAPGQTEYFRRTYELAGLAGQPAPRGEEPYGQPPTATEVAETLVSMLDPATWQVGGGEGRIDVQGELLSIRQSTYMHGRVERFLQTIGLLEQ